MLDKQIDFFGFIVCFENPALRTGSQKETLALSCFLCLTRPGKTKPPVSRVVVYFPDGRGREIRVR